MLLLSDALSDNENSSSKLSSLFILRFYTYGKITSVLLKTILFEAISTDLKCVSFFTNLSTIKLLSLSLSLIFLPSSVIYPSVKLKKLWVDFLKRGGQGRMTNINDDVLKSFKLIVVPMYTQYLSS